MKQRKITTVNKRKTKENNDREENISKKTNHCIKKKPSNIVELNNKAI